MSDRDLTWAVINMDRTDGDATDAAARYVGGLERQVQALRAQALRVRQACDAAFPINDIPTLVVTRSAVLHALDGGGGDE